MVKKNMLFLQSFNCVALKPLKLNNDIEGIEDNHAVPVIV